MRLASESLKAHKEKTIESLRIVEVLGGDLDRSKTQQQEVVQAPAGPAPARG